MKILTELRADASASAFGSRTIFPRAPPRAYPSVDSSPCVSTIKDDSDVVVLSSLERKPKEPDPLRPLYDTSSRSGSDAPGQCSDSGCRRGNTVAVFARPIAEGISSF